MRVALAQINPIGADITGNAARILPAIAAASGLPQPELPMVALAHLEADVQAHQMVRGRAHRRRASLR